MAHLEPASPQDSGLDNEVFTFITKLLPAVDLVNYVVVVWLSTRPWLTLIIALCFPIVGVGGIKIAERLKKNVAKPQMIIIVLLHFLICSVSGPQSPAWLVCIPGLVASVFLIPKMRLKIGFLCAILIAAGLGNYLSGKDYLTILAVTIALGGFAGLLFRTYQFLRKINERLEIQNIAIEREREKSENLLLNILPKEIAATLKNERRTIADYYDQTSILFADVVNFTPMSAHMTPIELVELLDEVFSYFDTLVEKHELEKIKTIGDCYMVAAGVPRPRSDHAQVLARMALDMREYVRQREFRGRRLNFRIGFNSGPVVAGVIGRKKFTYDLWGDAVNTASRMESHGTGGKIQITQATYDLIKEDFICEPRGTVAVKGKSEMEVWHIVEARR